MSAWIDRLCWLAVFALIVWATDWAVRHSPWWLS
jgi:hypothetical protein